ncbi:MAG TPA: FAD-binding oxidoreductase [Magnetospirillaceae bacterium]|jgi:glycine/D-amino acid oxidase-like deaminating enzyme
MASRSDFVDLSFRPWLRRAPHRSYWLREALASDAMLEQPSLTGDHRYDVCIVGGGFTGLWTAIRLREQDAALRIAIVEADICGSGASGRNSGGTGHWWGKLPTLLRLLGKDDGVQVLNQSVAILDDLRGFIAAEGIDCRLRRGPAAWTTTTKAQVGGWNAVYAAAERAGVTPPYRKMEAAEIRGLFGQGPFFTGVVEENGTRIQPALLARALHRLALARGIDIFEHTPVSFIASREADVLVHLSTGQVAAQQVVLAANAWMAHLPQFRASTMVVSSEIVITDPIPGVLKQHGLENRPGGVTSSPMLNYGGYTPDGRVYVGGGGTTIAYRAQVGAAFEHSPRATASVTRDFRYLYPELTNIPVAESWSGPIDRSTTGLPVFGRLSDPRIHYAIGYTGHGVAATAIGGRAIADAILDRDTVWTDVARLLRRAHVGIFPSEPLRYLGGRLVQKAVVRKEKAERAQRPAAKADVRLAKLAYVTWPDRQGRR